MGALEDGAQVNLTDMQSVTAVARAAQYGHDAIIRILHENGADLNLADQNGWAPIHFAAAHGNVACMKVLSELGADLKQMTKFHRNALDLVEENIFENPEDAQQARLQKLFKAVNRVHQDRLDAAKMLKDAGVITSCQRDLLKHARLGEVEFAKQA